MGNREQGFSALYVSVLVVFLTLSIGASIFLLTSTSQRIVTNARVSLQSLYTAESGIEDALLRLTKGTNWINPLLVPFTSGQAQTTISDLIGGSRTVLATGTVASRTRKVQAVYAIDSSTPSFFYGAHIGTGGLVMDNLSKVVGNVFSNGGIQASSGTQITGTATVAGANTMSNASIGQDAYVQSCVNSSVGGTLHAETQSGCTFGSFTTSGIPVSPAPLPISQAQIDQWKQDALAGGVLSGNYELSGTQSATLGPKKIEGNLMLQTSAQLTLTGTLWVTGTIDVKNSAQVRLAASYGTLSGVLVNDGTVMLQNNSISSGSGQQGSYLMYLSTSSLLPEAITIKNNAAADVLYTSQGGIAVENNFQLREVTGKSIHLKNSATITHEIGLQNATFVSGPAGGWRVMSWKERE